MTWSAREPPDAADLLATARQTILDQILPHLEGPPRFAALMTANAIAIALRAPEAAAIDAIATRLGDPATLVSQIRAGSLDDNTQTQATLLALAEAKCRVSAPKAIQSK